MFFPLLAPKDENGNAIEQTRLTGAELDPVISDIAAGNPYTIELNDPVDPALADYNNAVSQRVQAVAQIEETEGILKQLCDLDKRQKTAQTGIHKTLASHQQFLLKNQNTLQSINLAHQLQLAGIQQESQKQQAEFRGLSMARNVIAQKMRA